MGLYKHIYGLKICDINANDYITQLQLGPFIDKPFSHNILKEMLKNFQDNNSLKGIRTYFIYIKYKLPFGKHFIWKSIDYDKLCSIINNNTKQSGGMWESNPRRSRPKREIMPTRSIPHNLLIGVRL